MFGKREFELKKKHSLGEHQTLFQRRARVPTRTPSGGGGEGFAQERKHRSKSWQHRNNPLYIWKGSGEFARGYHRGEELVG